MMKKIKRISQMGVIGAVVATLTLVSLAFISFPQGLEYPGVPILTGQLTLSETELSSYLSTLGFQYILDSLLLLGWITSWAAVGAVVYKRCPFLGVLTLIFGLLGACLDFSENAIIWGVVQRLRIGLPLNGDWLGAWKTIQNLSYWLPFTGAVFAAAGLWNKHWQNRVMALVGTLGIATAAVGMYIPSLFLLPNVWFLLWFVGSGLLLIRYAFKKKSKNHSHQSDKKEG